MSDENMGVRRKSGGGGERVLRRSDSSWPCTRARAVGGVVDRCVITRRVRFFNVRGLAGEVAPTAAPESLGGGCCYPWQRT